MLVKGLWQLEAQMGIKNQTILNNIPLKCSLDSQHFGLHSHRKDEATSAWSCIFFYYPSVMM